MSRYENVQVRVTYHAFTQYCSRVESAERERLNETCTVQLKAADYDYDRRNFIRLSGVWWVYELSDNVMLLITCYGKTDFNIPKALGWAARNHDRLNLDVFRSEAGPCRNDH